MTSTVTLNQALEVFGKLSGEDQDMMREIARHRRIEQHRKEMAAYARKAKRDYLKGKLKAEPLDQMLKRLHKLADAAR